MAPILPQKLIYWFSRIQFFCVCWKDSVHYGIGGRRGCIIKEFEVKDLWRPSFHRNEYICFLESNSFSVVGRILSIMESGGQGMHNLGI